MSKPDIILDLSTPLNNHFEPSTSDNQQLLQIDAIEQINKLIMTIHQQAKKIALLSENNKYDEFNPLRCNNTIFIHGERGAGKTTFLRAVIDKYKREGLQDQSEIIKISPIPLIDPTLVQTHQHILVDIITKFVRLIDDKLKCCADEKKYQQFRDKLEKMAEGLKLLNISDHGKAGHSDAAWFLDRALNKATSGQDLERCFHQLLDTMSSILNTDLFLIAIDDVDTQTAKAYEVLEVLRCYLTHPKLVILISGDLKLYSHIVRNQKQGELNTHKDTSLNSDNLIGHLEQQYLTKILPIDQRIKLKGLKELSDAYYIQIKHPKIKSSTDNSKNKSDDPSEISELIKTIFHECLNIQKTHLGPHLDFLLGQPVRSILQLLKTVIDTRSPETLKKAIYHNFIGNLVSEGLKLENLEQLDPHVNSLGHESFQLLYKHGELETGFYARPDSSHHQTEYNVAKLYLSTTVSTMKSYPSRPRDVSQIIKLMLTFGASSNIYLTYVENRSQSNANHNTYLDYIGLNRNERIVNLASHFSQIILDDYNPQTQKAIRGGVVRTLKRKPKSFNEDSFSNFLNLEKQSTKKRITSINYLLSISGRKDIELDLANHIAEKTILLASHSTATTVGNIDFISIYRLLAAISEILDPNTDIDTERLAYIQTYVYPNFLTGRYTGDESTIIPEHENEEPANEIIPNTENESDNRHNNTTNSSDKLN